MFLGFHVKQVFFDGNFFMILDGSEYTWECEIDISLLIGTI
jgi:hypothetical protein